MNNTFPMPACPAKARLMRAAANLKFPRLHRAFYAAAKRDAASTETTLAWAKRCEARDVASWLDGWIAAS